MDAWLGFAVLTTAILGFAVVNSIEIAVVGANRIRTRHLAEEGSQSARALERLHQNQDRFFAAIVLLQNLMSVAAAAAGSLVGNELAGPSGVLFAVALITLATTEFGELTPKVLAAHASERYALFVALPAEGLTRVLGPIVLALGYIPGLISRRLFGVRLHAGPEVTEAELRMLIDLSAESGSVAEAEAALLDRVFHFGDRQVHEVMTPRTETVWLSIDARVSDFYKAYSRAPHSRFPVFGASYDRVLGILGIKDVLAGLARGEIDGDSDIEPLMRPPFFVPETKAIGELLREMQTRGVQMAVAVDEFGGIAGIVTLEQVLEEMVGPVHDELRPGELEIQPIDERTIQVDGTLSVEEAREELGIDIPEGPYDTIAGFVLSRLGRVPRQGEQLLLEGFRITVAEMKGPKIERLLLTQS